MIKQKFEKKIVLIILLINTYLCLMANSFPLTDHIDNNESLFKTDFINKNDDHFEPNDVTSYNKHLKTYLFESACIKNYQAVIGIDSTETQMIIIFTPDLTDMIDSTETQMMLIFTPDLTDTIFYKDMYEMKDNNYYLFELEPLDTNELRYPFIFYNLLFHQEKECLGFTYKNKNIWVFNVFDKTRLKFYIKTYVSKNLIYKNERMYYKKTKK